MWRQTSHMNLLEDEQIAFEKNVQIIFSCVFMLTKYYLAEDSPNSHVKTRTWVGSNGPYPSLVWLWFFVNNSRKKRDFNKIFSSLSLFNLTHVPKILSS